MTTTATRRHENKMRRPQFTVYIPSPTHLLTVDCERRNILKEAKKKPFILFRK